MQEAGFEPAKHNVAVDLKSTPFDHSGTPAHVHRVGFEPTKHYAPELESGPFDHSGICACSVKRNYCV